MSITGDNILFLCRLCGISTKSFNRINIFDIAGVELHISSKINTCLGIDVSENDYLPKVLCNECIEKLQKFSEFKMKSHETTLFLKDLFQQQMSSIIDDRKFDRSKQSSLILSENVFESELEIKTSKSELVKVVLIPPKCNKKSSSLLQKSKLSSVKPSDNFSQINFSAHEKSSKLINEVEPSMQNDADKLALVHKQIRNAVKINKPKKSKFTKTLINCNINESFKCAFCSKEYSEKFKLKRHIKIHTNDKKYNCVYCEKKFLSKGALNVHVQRHEKRYDYVCNYCGQGVIGKASFDYHVRTKHTKEYPFPCTKCDKKFVTKMALKNHDIGVHNDNRFLFNCEICNKTFKTKIYLKSHKKSHEVPLEVRKKFKCTICNAALTTKRSLQHHLITHSGETPYECEICKNRYNSKDGLRIHLLIHSGVKKFICDYCGKAFALKESLICHRRMHTGEKPFRCDVCLQNFTQRSSLNTHRKKACPGRAKNLEER